MKKRIHVAKGENVIAAIQREDNGANPLVNFEVIKVQNQSPIGEGVVYPSVSQSIRRADNPAIELGVATGSIGGEYTAAQNMEAIGMFFPETEGFEGELVLWSVGNGKRVGVEAFSRTANLKGENWKAYTTVTNSHDLTNSLETSGVLIRESDGLRFPITLEGGQIAVKHTKNMAERASLVANYREAVAKVIDEQIQLMEAFAGFDMNWNQFKAVLVKAHPAYDASKASATRGDTRRKNIIASIGAKCGSADNALAFLIGYMEYIAFDSKSRTSKGKDAAEVKFLSLTSGDKFGKIAKVQKALNAYIANYDPADVIPDVPEAALEDAAVDAGWDLPEVPSTPAPVAEVEETPVAELEDYPKPKKSRKA